ncbi:MAG TPA: SprT-like domain-containing protein [Bacteroidia bacterium]|nr:SprT-like domain-containing protein [Bacteroidia bacterium]HMY42207.1 SprT-like domain-containing protein [Chitinophagales bacterium]
MEKEKVIELAHSLMKEHGIYHSWRFTFDRAKLRNGLCQYRTKTISLSENYIRLNTDAKIKNTILHEIAHALVGKKHGHDAVWRAKAIEIGCSGERCTSNTLHIEGKYIATCKNCGKVSYRYKKPKINRVHSCGKCSGGRYNPLYKLDWELVTKHSVSS